LQVYHAHPKNWADFVKNAAANLTADEPQQHCVALKEANYADMNPVMHNEIAILKEFAKLDEAHHQHFVKFYYEGTISGGSGKKAYIMELGQMSLWDYFNANAGQLTEEQVIKVAKHIGLAMHHFHRGLWAIAKTIPNIQIM
jgi:hypothetical protein